MAENVQKSRWFTVENNVYKGPVVDVTAIYKTSGEMMWDKLNSYGNRVAQIDGRTEETVTYAELQVKAIKCALWLKQEGIGRGDVVTICTDIHLNSFVPCLSTMYLNAIFNTWCENTDLRTAMHHLKLLKPKAIFCSAKPLDIIRKAVKETNCDVKVIVFDDRTDAFSFSDILSGYSNADVANFRYVKSGDTKDTVCIVHSSGTTGMPKDIELPHYTLLSPDWIDSDTVYLWFSSFFWLSAVVLTVQVFMHGAKVLVYPTFDENMTCALIEKFKVTRLFLGTSMFYRWFKVGSMENYSLSSLKDIIFGGAILKPKVQEELKNLLSRTNIFQFYGLTELGGITTLQKPGQKNGSCGVVTPNTQLKIVDPDTGKVLGPNKKGEVWVKMRTMMNGYYNNPEATRDTIDEDGWLHTADIGYVDEDGELFIWDKIKEILKFRDDSVSPGEIEGVMNTHPAVCEVAVVGMPHETDIERPLAFVTKKSGVKVTEQELIDFVANNMMDQYKLRGGVVFLERFPYTSSGKIERKELKAIAKKLATDTLAK